MSSQTSLHLLFLDDTEIIKIFNRTISDVGAKWLSIIGLSSAFLLITASFSVKTSFTSNGKVAVILAVNQYDPNALLYSSIYAPLSVHEGYTPILLTGEDRLDRSIRNFLEYYDPELIIAVNCPSNIINTLSKITSVQDEKYSTPGEASVSLALEGWSKPETVVITMPEDAVEASTIASTLNAPLILYSDEAISQISQWNATVYAYNFKPSGIPSKYIPEDRYLDFFIGVDGIDYIVVADFEDANSAYGRLSIVSPLIAAIHNAPIVSINSAENLILSYDVEYVAVCGGLDTFPLVENGYHLAWHDYPFYENALQEPLEILDSDKYVDVAVGRIIGENPYAASALIGRTWTYHEKGVIKDSLGVYSIYSGLDELADGYINALSAADIWADAMGGESHHSIGESASSILGKMPGKGLIMLVGHGDYGTITTASGVIDPQAISNTVLTSPIILSSSCHFMADLATPSGSLSLSMVSSGAVAVIGAATLQESEAAFFHFVNLVSLIAYNGLSIGEASKMVKNMLLLSTRGLPYTWVENVAGGSNTASTSLGQILIGDPAFTPCPKPKSKTYTSFKWGRAGYATVEDLTIEGGITLDVLGEYTRDIPENEIDEFNFNTILHLSLVRGLGVSPRLNEHEGIADVPPHLYIELELPRGDLHIKHCKDAELLYDKSKNNGKTILHISLTVRGPNPSFSVEYKVKPVKISDSIREAQYYQVYTSAYGPDMGYATMLLESLGVKSTLTAVNPYYTLIVGGPLANQMADEYNKWIGLSFTISNGRVTLNLEGLGNYTGVSSFGFVDYAAIINLVDDGRKILLIEGCTRYGTIAAIKYIASNPQALTAKIIVVSWKDMDGDGSVDIEEIKLKARI